MVKTLLSVLITLLMLFSGSCKENDAESSLENKILGNWLVVDDQGTQISVEWGFYYVGSVKLHQDKSFKINLSTSVDVVTAPRQGTWELKGNSITFYSEMNNLGTIERNVTGFNVSFDSGNNLVAKRIDFDPPSKTEQLISCRS